MSEEQPHATALVVGHKDFAAGLVSAVAAITGRDDVFRAVSNAGLDARGIEALLKEAIVTGVRVIFSDLPAGSTTMAARRVQREFPFVTVVTGVSLPVLLDFVFSSAEPADAADAAVAAGRTALTIAKGRTDAD
jgi:N-acetylgalactosamine PTS system EIIA component